MSVLDELADALKNYPQNSVEISIVNYSPPPGGFKVGTHATFKVRVRNNGALDMLAVKLHIHGLRIDSVQYTQLSQSDIGGTPVNFLDNITTAAMHIPAGASATTRTLYLLGCNKTPGAGSHDLVEAHVSAWDASLGSLLKDATVNTLTPAGVHTGTVST